MKILKPSWVKSAILLSIMLLCTPAFAADPGAAQRALDPEVAQVQSSLAGCGSSLLP